MSKGHKRASVLFSVVSLVSTRAAKGAVQDGESDLPPIKQVVFGIDMGASVSCGAATGQTSRFECGNFYGANLLSHAYPMVGLEVMGIDLNSITAYEETPNYDLYQRESNHLGGMMLLVKDHIGPFKIQGAFGPMGGTRHRKTSREIAEVSEEVASSSHTIQGFGAMAGLECTAFDMKALGSVDVGARMFSFAANQSSRPKDSRSVIYSYPMVSLGWQFAP